MRKKKVVIYLFYNDSTSSVVLWEEYFINIRYVIYISHDHDEWCDMMTTKFLNVAVSSHLQVAGRYNSDKKFENGGHFFYDGKFKG